MEIDDEAIEKGLRNSLFSICVLFNNKVIGCGRIVGDDGIYFYIQDVIVLPEFQRKGIGKRIMEAIIDYLKKHAHNNSFIGLMAAKGVAEFYKKWKFKKRADDAPGMFLIWKTD